MIKRVLVANRGEIAVRVARACRELGIESVAVYSDADAGAMHVAEADHSVRLGPAPAAESYLSSQKIIEAALATGADAVHPGYGFLSENAAFAEACTSAGLTFIGPPAAVIAAMGSKVDARKQMQSAGVPVVPGATPDDQSDAGIARAVKDVGLPALIKASSGGGGKGMRDVREGTDVAGTIQSARREATTAFGRGTLYVERLIDRPHHVEVQVFADAHGQVVHLFERECSVQRRHQKVIEESPSPILTPRLRQRMTAAAVTAAAAAGYRNAGTIEFLVDVTAADRDEAPFYFLEMNTRLQVEHGVTEAVVGVDLVRAQLLVADGQPLPWTQDQLAQRGHAIEARVYAEDPAQGFLPQAGQVLLYREPRRPGIRIDAGIREGDHVSVHYDPLLAKVVAWAETRELAIARLAAALEDFPVLGIRTNIPFLLSIVNGEAFREARIDTGYLDREVPATAAQEPLPEVVRAVFAQATTTGVRRQAASASPGPWDALKGWRG